MLEHELSTEQQNEANDLLLAFNALIKHGMPLKDVSQIVVEAALETEDRLAE